MKNYEVQFIVKMLSQPSEPSNRMNRSGSPYLPSTFPAAQGRPCLSGLIQDNPPSKVMLGTLVSTLQATLVSLYCGERNFDKIR